MTQQAHPAPPAGQRILRAALIGAALGTVIALVDYVLFAIAFAIAFPGQAGWAEPAALALIGTGVIVTLSLLLAVVVPLRKAGVHPAWGVALGSPVIVAALSFIAVISLGVLPALFCAPALAAAGYALGAAVTTRHSR